MFKIARYQLPNDKLKTWVKFIWHFYADSVDVHHKLLPMDNIDIMINLTGDMVYETATDKITAPNIHINGLRSQYSFILQTGRIDVWGISFYSFGLYPFVNSPITAIQNKIVDLYQLSMPLADKLKAAAANLETAERKVDRIADALISEQRSSEKCLHRTRIIKEFLSSDDTLPIGDFCMNYGIHQRTFERFVRCMTGYTPADLRRIRRYQAASNQLLEKSSKISEIVYNNNYADQPHFTKEIKYYSGVPPKIFQQEKKTVIENTDFI